MYIIFKHLGANKDFGTHIQGCLHAIVFKMYNLSHIYSIDNTYIRILFLECIYILFIKKKTFVKGHTNIYTPFHNGKTNTESTCKYSSHMHF